MESETAEQRYEQFVSLFTRNEPALRSFVRSLVRNWDDADEVMQNTGLVLWRKFADFESETDPQTDFFRWSCVVARFEVLAWRRDKARDRHVFDEDIVHLLADEVSREQEALERERKALELCLRKLPEKQRRIVIAAYEPGVRLNRVAEELGKTATAFYKMLNRTRRTLMECIGSVSEAELSRSEGRTG